MGKKLASRLLVLIPHASTKRPKEIKKNALSKYQERLLFSSATETDRGTDKLYDFRLILKNRQIVFPFSQVYINVLRDPKRLADSVPLYIREIPIYKKGQEIDLTLRKKLIKKYHRTFYDKIRDIKPKLILNGHSTVAGHGSLKNKKLNRDIFLVNNSTEYNNKYGRIYKEVSDFYIKELERRLPHLKIGIQNIYSDVYDYIFKATKARIPILTQETNEKLYIKRNRVDLGKVRVLKKAFAEALLETVRHLKLI